MGVLSTLLVIIPTSPSSPLSPAPTSAPSVGGLIAAFFAVVLGISIAILLVECGAHYCRHRPESAPSETVEEESWALKLVSSPGKISRLLRNGSDVSVRQSCASLTASRRSEARRPIKI
mmetsp:Transcript_26678/g.65988  ORF Transcript_26678/g.65988 Transcript_26678/m.65988 type:complete len:119 (-) Transcript_26678:206-562(-)